MKEKKHAMPAPPFPAGEAQQPDEEIYGEENTSPKPAPAPPAPEKPADYRAWNQQARANPQQTQSTKSTVNESPPLFVKVEKYRNIVDNIQKLKSYSLGLRDALDALADIEKELQNGISVLNRALDNFNSIIGLLDAKLLRIQGIEKSTVETPKEMDEYVKGVYDQVERIKKDLKSME